MTKCNFTEGKLCVGLSIVIIKAEIGGFRSSDMPKKPGIYKITNEFVKDAALVKSDRYAAIGKDSRPILINYCPFCGEKANVKWKKKNLAIKSHQWHR